MSYRELTSPEVAVVSHGRGLAWEAARRISEELDRAVAERSRATLVLSGGSTPKHVYEVLATELSATVDWERIFVFFGDERTVPPSHPDSNFKMAREALLGRVPLPDGNVFRVPAELAPNEAASVYESRLREFFRSETDAWPRFDVTLLGLGDDGHTASLFPGTEALGEAKRWFVANPVPQLGTTRLTMTYPLLNHSACVLVLVSGGKKRAIFAEVMDGPVDRYPMQRVRLVEGRMAWMLDEAAGA